jgi:hypothetical protein
MRMLINISACMRYPARGYNFNTGRDRCKYLSQGVFGGYICKHGHQIESVTPRIGKDSEICKDKEVLG